MSIGFVSAAYLTDIGNAIRYQNGKTVTYTPSEMAQAVLDLDGMSLGNPGVETYKDIGTGLINRQYLENIASAIRSKNGSTDTYTPSQMAGAIRSLSWGEPRALLLSDGTLEFTYLGNANSPSGGSVVEVYSPVEGLSDYTKTPWYDKRFSITSVRFHSSFAQAGVRDISQWFAYCSNLTVVYGFENVSGIRTAEGAFQYCDKLDTIYADFFDETSLSNTSQAFYFTNTLVGGYGARPSGNTASFSLASVSFLLQKYCRSMT